AERRGVKVRVAEAIRREAVDVRRLDGRAVAAEVGEAGVIEDDRDYVWGSPRRRRRGRPPRLRLRDGLADHPFEFGTGLHFRLQARVLRLPRFNLAQPARARSRLGAG